MLYLIATPIGNLGDITLRALEVFRSVDYILCEDTRTSLILLKKYQIEKPLKSHHKFNESATLQRVMDDLKQGMNIALISDAGTPGICDPGASLLAECQKEGIPVTAVPGACALILALTLSGFPTETFQFIGFLPKTTGELQKRLVEALDYTGTTICYESPHRLTATLALLPPQRKVAVVREMTKIYEEARRGTAAELLFHFTNTPPRGEIVLLISGETRDFSSLSPEEHVAILQKEYSLSLQEAIKLAASLRKTPKRELYRIIHQLDP